MNRIVALPATIAGALLLSACASTAGEYPSLARRDIERVSGTAMPVEPAVPQVPPLPPSAATEARLAELLAQAREANQRFLAVRPQAQNAVAGAGGVASESWIDANVALSRLEAARSRAMVALAELDQLYAAERLENFNAVSPTAEAIAAARDTVDSWVQAQTDTIGSLSGRLPGA
ncbi:hypothetical protein GCM10011371_10510 [Novosphingobium marinum]|uniref:DUF4398 domain-containing protein n=1 Tax=Novosphingobium marinum TaxID=1514948 RepID=A0A7Y9XXF8_9SPHN|nr:hypothetical protein [Novosphingobium marinum]NYH95160.1 hypothetical protein [Novosphingobium marinum]GGC24796.1 hypothetical protein GCM10011371_10510 [Novosphingobium marinum]